MEKSELPNADQMSILAGSILLAYALARFIDLGVSDVGWQIGGLVWEFELNVRIITGLLVAGLTIAGVEWLIRNHPAAQGKLTLEHWLLPGLTAWVIGLPLYQLPLGYQWWLGFLLGGVLLVLVVVGEYIAVDPDDVRNPAAVAGLTAVGFALFLILAISLRVSGIRLFMILPALVLAGWLISLRVLQLRLHGQWKFLEASAITLISVHLAAALHYLPLSPLTYGLLLFGPIYALTSFVANLEEGEPVNQALIEPGIVLMVVFLAAWGLR